MPCRCLAPVHGAGQSSGGRLARAVWILGGPHGCIVIGLCPALCPAADGLRKRAGVRRLGGTVQGAPAAPLSRPDRDLYVHGVPRSLRTRVLACLLFLGAGVSAPAWELGHASRHLHEHDAEVGGPGGHHAPSAPGTSLWESAEHPGHDHPTFQAAARPFRDDMPASAALASRPPAMAAPRSIERAIPYSPVLPRAGPLSHGLAQPRAPPLP